MAAMVVVFVLLLCSLLGQTAQPVGDKLSARLKLYNDLFGSNSTYTPDVIPSNGNPINVTVSVTLLYLHAYNEDRRTLEISTYLSMSWIDGILRWNPNDYAGIKDISIPATKVWKPDIVPYVHPMSSIQSTFENNVILYADGKVLNIPHFNMELICHEVDYYNFPHDEITCKNQLGSWTYSSQLVNLSAEYFTNEYKDSRAEWQIESTSLPFTETKYACCPETYVDVTMLITLKRTSWHHRLFMVAPGAILGFILPLIYFIPPFRSERLIAIGVNVMALVFYIGERIGETIPRHASDVPRPANFYIGTLALNLGAMFWSVIAVNIWFQGGRTPHSPVILKRIVVDCLGKLLLLPAPQNYMEVYNRAHMHHAEDDAVDTPHRRLSLEGEEYMPPTQHHVDNMKVELTELQIICLGLDRLFGLITLVLIALMTASCFAG